MYRNVYKGVSHGYNMVVDRTQFKSIDIKIATRDRLNKNKIHPRQSHDEVINKGLDLIEENKE